MVTKTAQNACMVQMHTIGTSVRMSDTKKSTQQGASIAAIKRVLVMSIVHKEMINVSGAHTFF